MITKRGIDVDYLSISYCAASSTFWLEGDRGNYLVSDPTRLQFLCTALHQKWCYCQACLIFQQAALLDPGFCIASYIPVQGFSFTQNSGHCVIKILKDLIISKLQDNFCINLCEFHMPFIHMKPKCPVTKFDQWKPWMYIYNIIYI